MAYLQPALFLPDKAPDLIDLNDRRLKVSDTLVVKMRAACANLAEQAHHLVAVHTRLFGCLANGISSDEKRDDSDCLSNGRTFMRRDLPFLWQANNAA